MSKKCGTSADADIRPIPSIYIYILGKQLIAIFNCLLQSLVTEVNVLRRLHHPNIVSFYNYLVDQQTGTLFIFMEY